MFPSSIGCSWDPLTAAEAVGLGRPLLGLVSWTVFAAAAAVLVGIDNPVAVAFALADATVAAAALVVDNDNSVAVAFALAGATVAAAAALVVGDDKPVPVAFAFADAAVVVVAAAAAAGYA